MNQCEVCTIGVTPGVDPSTYLDIYDGKSEQSEHADFRYFKIVSLAKNSRNLTNLTVALNKEKDINASSKKRTDDLFNITSPSNGCYEMIKNYLQMHIYKLLL